MNDRVVTFKGKRIDDMTRAELIDVLNYAAEQLRQEQERNARDLEFIFDAFSLKIKTAQ